MSCSCGKLLALVVLAASVAVSGCAAPQVKMDPIVGSWKEAVSLPYTRTMEEASAEVRRQVEPLMIDEAAKNYRDSVIADMVKDHGPLTTGDGADLHKKIVQELLVNDVKRSLQPRAIFTMVRHLDRHTVKGDIFHWNAQVNNDATADKGSFTGQLAIGKNYCWYNSAAGTRNCNEEESYTLGLTGTYAYSKDSLDILYRMDLLSHHTEIGLHSKLNREALSRDLTEVSSDYFDKLKKDIDRRYDGVVSHAAGKIRDRLANRVRIAKPDTYTMKEYPVSTNFETSVARLQRKLDRFKYDKESSTFIFTDDYKTATFYGITKNIPSKLTVKLFPEKSGTVAVFQLDCTTATDDLTGKELVTLKQAAKEYESQVAQIERILRQ